MNTEPNGSRTSIIGSIIANAPADPIPGNTPTTVPKNDPNNAYVRYLTSRTSLNPSIKFEKITSNILINTFFNCF